MGIELITNFRVAADSDIISNTAKSHSVVRVQRVNDNSISPKTWIAKLGVDEHRARAEVLAQEFFRAIIPYQPETILAREGNNYLVLSEEIKGYGPLPVGRQDRFATDDRKKGYKGLGLVLVAAMFFQETDLKNGNVGLDNKRRIVKIDGDHCFRKILRTYPDSPHHTYNITPNSINYLPYPQDYYVFNWLDLKNHELDTNNPMIVDPATLSNAPQFRAEVNEALLKICLMTDSFIEALVDAIIPSDRKSFIDLIKSRREELLKSALLNNSFKQYLASPDAEVAAQAMLSHMRSFKVSGTEPIQDRGIKNEFIDRSNFMVCYKLLNVIRSNKLPGMESGMKKYIKQMEDLIRSKPYDKRIEENLSSVIGCLEQLSEIRGADRKYISFMRDLILANHSDNTKLVELEDTLSFVVDAFKSDTPGIKENLILMGECGSLLNQFIDGKPNFIAFMRDQILSNFDNKENLLLFKKDLSISLEGSLKIYNLSVLNKGMGLPFITYYCERKLAEISQPLPPNFNLTKFKEDIALRIECIELLREIESYRLGPDDEQTNQYIRTKNFELSQNIDSNSGLKQIREQLKVTLQSVSSPEIDEVKAQEKLERETATSFSRNKTEKANKIWNALIETPLDQRGSVISVDDHPVQHALAWDRYRSATPLTPEGKIDMKKAVQSFKDIKAKYQGNRNQNRDNAVVLEAGSANVMTRNG